MKKEEFVDSLKGFDVHDGNLTDQDALALIDLSKKSAKPRCNFLEIGSWKGKSTACLSVVAVKANGRVWCIDHFMGTPETSGEDIAKYTDVQSIFRNNMRVINAWQSVVSVIVAPLEEAVTILPANFFDFIFIDADNRYDTMKLTLQQYWKKLKNRGVICGRNLLYDYRERRHEVDEEIGKEYSSKYLFHPGIIKAVHEFSKGDYNRIENSTLWYKVKNKK